LINVSREEERTMGKQRLVWGLYVAWTTCLLAGSTNAAGQTVRSGSIDGTITDDTGGVLPGVTVTLTSPALQVPQLVRTSEARGEYQFLDLPPGAYRLVYELQGFTSLVREQIQLTAGFAARVDVVLNVGSVTERVTVSGASPLVDVTNTSGGTTVSQDLIAATPNNQNYQDVFLLVGGVQIQGAPLTGDSGLRTLGDQVAPLTYGQALRTTNMIEGIRVLPNEAPDFTSFEEVDVKTFGQPPEIPIPGAAVQLIVKSGGNQFHGRYTEKYQPQALESTNVDAALQAQGISAGNAFVYYQDASGDLGGRIIRDKLWFYGAFHDLRNERTLPGYTGQPRSTTQNETAKVSYQATSHHRFIGFWSRDPVVDENSEASRFIPPPSTTILSQTAFQSKIEWQGTLTGRLLANTMYAESWYDAARAIQPESLNVPSTLDLQTLMQTGGNFNSLMGVRTPRRKQLSGHLDYLPSGSWFGSHEVRTGYYVQVGSFATNFPSEPAGNYQLVFNQIGGVPHQPFEVVIQGRPVAGESRQNLYSAFASDQWRPAKRLTVNVGLRWERNVNWVPPQVKVDSIFAGTTLGGTSGTFPRVDAGSFWGLSPRTGIAFDPLGDGKTVVKATYGRYNLEWPQNYNVGFAQDYNKNGTTTVYTYLWHVQPGAPVDVWQPGQTNLNLNGPDFVSVVGAANTVVNPNIRMPHEHELTGSIERELGGTVSLRGLYVYKRVVDNLTLVNAARPSSVWNQVFNRRDPGPDGKVGTADDGGLITFYDYDPAYRGSNFVENMYVNGSRTDHYHNFEITLNKRQAGKWFAFTSFLATKNYRWPKSAVETPNDLLFPLDETWALAYRLAGGYELPYRIILSTLYQAYNGIPAYRTVLFSAVDPAGGPRLPSSATFLLPVEPFGTERTPARNIVNLRASKSLLFGAGRKLTMNIDLFNIFNSSVPWGDTTAAGVVYQSGPTFGYVTQIVSPRAARLGLAFEF
jgi:hypothetical protein